MKIRILLLSFLSLFFITTIASAQSTYLKYPDKTISSFNENSDLEVGFHYGTALSLWKIRNFAKVGDSYSLDFNLYMGEVIAGTELTIISWRDYLKSEKTEEFKFRKVNFSWLVQAKYLIGDGRVQPYFGAGTDLVSFIRIIQFFDDDDDDDLFDDDDHSRNDTLTYWFVPSFGLRWEMRSRVCGNIGISLNASNKHTFLRFQVGVILW